MEFGESLGLESRDDPRKESMTGTNARLDWESNCAVVPTVSGMRQLLEARVRFAQRAHQPREAVRKAS